MRAVNANGNSGNATEVEFRPDDMPPAPTDLKATVGNAQVKLDWTAPSHLDITGYAFSSDGGNNYTPIANSATTTSHPVTGLINGTEYTFSVRALNYALNDEVDGIASETVMATPGLPPAPTLTVVSKTEAITLRWTAPSYSGMPALTRYEYRYTNMVETDGAIRTGFTTTPKPTMDSGPWAATSATDPLDRELTLTLTDMDVLLEAGETYYFQVRAVNSIGEGPAIRPLPAASQPPSQPVGPSR